MLFLFAVLKKYKDIPEVRPHDSLPGVRVIRDIPIGDLKLNVAVVTGTKNIRAVVDRVLEGDKSLHLIEVMACPGLACFCLSFVCCFHFSQADVLEVVESRSLAGVLTRKL